MVADRQSGKRQSIACVAIAFLMAIALVCLPLPNAGASTQRDASGQDAPFVVALTIVDTKSANSKDVADVLFNGVVTGLSSENTVADLLSAAGFKEVSALADTKDNCFAYSVNFGVSPEFKGKTSTYPDGYDYWQTMYDGSADSPGCEQAYVSAKLQANGHYQYIYGDTGTFEYTKTIPNPLEVNNDGTSSVAYSVNVYDSSKFDTLKSNLSKRFSKNGKDASIDLSSADAAIALNSLGLASSIDVASIMDSLANYESTMGKPLGAGQYAKYIMALTAAGVDCTKVLVNGSAQNLVGNMQKLIDVSMPSVYDLVWILSVYSQGVYSAPDGMIDKIIDELVKSQASNGLFGGYGYFDSQTTAQAILALAPYGNNDKVKESIQSAVSMLENMLLPDGGFAYNVGDSTSNIDATSCIVAAMISQGIDCAGANKKLVTSNGSTPMGYVTAKADSSLDGYANSGSYNELMTSSGALLALAAQAKYSATGKAYDIYTLTPCKDTVVGTWARSKGKWWFKEFNGSYPRNSWELIGGKWYHFDASGWMQTGWQKLGKHWYYLGTANDGVMKTGWVKVKGTWYHMSSNGAMQSGWQKIDKTWYYLGASSDGAMKTGWVKVKGTWYYMKKSGAMVSNAWSGNYWLKSSGAMAVSQWVDSGKYYVDSNGVWVKGMTR